jgi:hypothetical protein
VQYWRSGKSTEGLSDESLRAIAAYRNESPEETRAWLEGKLREAESSLVRLMRSAPLPEVTAALEVGLARLSGLLAQVPTTATEEEEVSTKRLAELIQAKLQIDGIDLDDLAQICEFSRATMRQLSEGIIPGDPIPKLIALAPNLYYPCTSQPFTSWQALADYLQKSPTEAGENGHDSEASNCC